MVFHDTFQHYEVPCNARIAEKTARLAISYINEDRTEGYKLSLNRINRVFGSHQGAAGKVYYLDLDVLETKCYIRSALPWEDCDIRPFVETVSGTCRAIVHIKPDVSAITCGYNCSLAPDAKENITSICPECLTFITPDSRESMKAVNLTLNKFNKESDESRYFAAAKVIRALSSTLTQPGQDYHVEFTIEETDCIKGRDGIGRSCTFKSPETARTGFCVGDVYIKDGADVEASCELYDPKGPNDAPQGMRDCDSPEGEEAAAVAVDYINAHHAHGYKYALNRIEKLRVLPTGPSSERVILELDLLETKCHVLNPLPLENCTVRELTGHAVEGDCDVKLLRKDGKLSVLAAHCHSSPDSAEDIIKICPDCALLIPLNDTQVVKAVELLLDQYHSTNDVYFTLVEIARAQMQAPNTIIVEFAISATNCSSKDASEHAEACQALSGDQTTFGFCVGSVMHVPNENIHVECEVYAPQPDVVHPVLAKDTVGLLSVPVHGFSHHNLRHSHSSHFNDSSESNSAEVSVACTLSPKLVVKRTVSEPEHPGGVLDPLHPGCPGRALCSQAFSTPVKELQSPFLFPACNDSAVESAVDVALGQINTGRTEGYVLRLNRIFSVLEHPQETSGSVFYLILDVAETECHVLSRRLWKNCKTRPQHKTVFGQCRTTLYINNPKRIAHLHSYECTLRPVPTRSILMLCPDCPIFGCPTEPKYLETAVVSLAKFNSESTEAHYFSVLNVTKASMQWVVGPAYFVEFTIQETSCSRNESIADISKCKPLPFEKAHTGFCKGSVVNSQVDHHQFVNIDCEIYEPQVPAIEKQKETDSHKPGHGGDGSHEDPHHPRRKGAHPHQKHQHRHKQHEEKHPSPTEAKSPVEYIDGNPVLPEVGMPVPDLPDIHGAPDGEKILTEGPGGKLGLIKPKTGPVFLSFPDELSHSDMCPGEPTTSNSFILNLLPRKHIKESPTATPLS
ncbi:fetuin-B precursor isoform B [Alligator mississippiensis]|uniref:Fetuin-B isoform B n=1 Tax=Alligator mississippiensis TaxID=8496 RepID=A0A151M7P5_ALLMI|nr:fetuin-B precursor isoform B [Alligator mississippiensis]